jgi:hypothetical protein
LYAGGENYFSTAHNDSIWVPLFEKAWAKMKGNYENSAGGWTQNPFRALTGAPVFEYWTTDDPVTSDELWTRFKAADDLNYLLGAGTDGDDSLLNSCNIVAGHAYTMISVFELKTAAVVDHKMYMLRNPWDTTYHDGKWKSSSSLWTSDYISQVPHGVNPTTADKNGIFFIESTDFQSCFSDYHIGHLRDSEGYNGYWYD